MPRKTDILNLTLTSEQAGLLLAALKQATAHLSFPRRQREIVKLLEACLLECRDAENLPRSGEPEALKRLERWLLIRERGKPRWGRYFEPPSRRGGLWSAEVVINANGFRGRGKTLSTAINAALDQVEAEG